MAVRRLRWADTPSTHPPPLLLEHLTAPIPLTDERATALHLRYPGLVVRGGGPVRGRGEQPGGRRPFGNVLGIMQNRCCPKIQCAG
ncbi:hypothetical protein [Streptomyces sp. NPDC054783]